jgi:putative chitinase
MNYDLIRPLFGGHMAQSQVDGLETILSACKVFTDKRHTAYCLATVFHECAKTMQPISEFGKGSGHDYGKKLKMGGGPGHRIPYTTPDQLYYGRGYVQLTWYENYQSLGKLIKQDLLNHPELCLQPAIAAQIMITGMTKGLFTGKTLHNYFNDTTDDPINARKIINGLDAAQLIAGYYYKFLKAL